LAAFNKMSAAQQEVLKRSGQREAYLKGETTLAKAKALLRPQAVALHIAKPLRQRGGAISPPEARKEKLMAMVQLHLRTKIVDAGRDFNQQTSDEEIAFLDPETGMLRWDYGRISYEGRRGSEYEVVGPDGQTHNPFWYH
jgi:hypothetical protein